MAKKNSSNEPEEKQIPANDPYANKLDAIKNIIFGEDHAELLRQINELREKVAADLESLDDRLNGVIKDVDQTISSRIDNLEMDLKNEIDRLDDNKADRRKLGKMLEDIGRSLQE